MSQTPETSPGRFHLAVPVDDLDAARGFYGEVLGCAQGRSAPSWVDWNFFGHQLVTHLAPRPDANASGAVDGHDVPVPHYGAILPVEEFHRVAGRLREAGTAFLIEPEVRFEGEPGEQWTMFVRDPAGNALEFKAFEDDAQVFAT